MTDSLNYHPLAFEEQAENDSATAAELFSDRKN